MLSDPADFLLLVPVSVFFPGLSYHIARIGCSHRHEAAPRPVPHGSPDPFHQGTNVLLEKETQSAVTEEKILNHCSMSVKPDTGKLKPSRTCSAPAPELQEGQGRQPEPASSSSSAKLCRVPSIRHRRDTAPWPASAPALGWNLTASARHTTNCLPK